MTNSETKICQNCHNSFVIDAQDFEFYQKIKVPPPTWCPECRAQRRFMFRNERFLYRRPDTRAGEIIFSMFSKSSPVKVYEREFWFSDEWDPMVYGRAIDWDRSFLAQVFDLMREVPWRSRSVIYLTNSDFCNNAGNLKNCYLLFNSDYSENCLYSVGISQSRECIDCLYVQKSELCFESFFLENCYHAYFSSHCENCQDIWFLKNCIGCTNCFGCVNLRHKSYHIFNQPYSKEEYFRKLQEFNLNSFQALSTQKEKSYAFWLGFPVKFMSGRHNVNVSGDYITNSKHTLNSYRIDQAENCKHCQLWTVSGKWGKDCYDYTVWGENSELVYEALQVGKGASLVRFSLMCFPDCRDIYYSIMCGSSSNLFGCVGLRHKEYCILNKQYTKEEYERLVPKIIEHMNKMPYVDKKGRVYKYGEFFPPELSPFAYNETIAQEYFPLTKEEAIEQGYRWKEPEERNIKIDIKSEELPDNIKDVKDDILGKVIECQHQGKYNEQCTQGFKIIEPELQFYRRMNLPLPRLCPNCRHYQRLKQRNPLKLWHRKCMCGGLTSTNGVYQNTSKHFHAKEPCPNEFETTYAPERKEIVYCEECYLAEVV